MKKLNDSQRRREVECMMRMARSCDYGMTRTSGFFGRAIRFITSKGRYRALTNHNFPIWEDPESRILMTLQIEPPKAHVVTFREYLDNEYEKGGRVIIARPDMFATLGPSPDRERHMRSSWLAMVGTKYDKKSIWQILKMYCRVRKSVPDNSKEHVYCTEGTFAPFIDDLVGWSPDVLKGERYPAPIHAEHMLRQERAKFVEGSRDMLSLITSQ